MSKKPEELLDEILAFGYDDPAFINDIHVLIGGKERVEEAKQAILSNFVPIDSVRELIDGEAGEVIPYTKEQDHFVVGYNQAHKDAHDRLDALIKEKENE